MVPAEGANADNRDSRIAHNISIQDEILWQRTVSIAARHVLGGKRGQDRRRTRLASS